MLGCILDEISYRKAVFNVDYLAPFWVCRPGLTKPFPIFILPPLSREPG